MTAEEMLAEATRRYLFDAEFHARVELACRVWQQGDADDDALGVSLGLLIADLDPRTGALRGEEPT